MTLDVRQLVILGLLSASLHWIVGRSKLAQPLWSRARGWFGALLSCPACSGFWLGLGLGAAGARPVGGLSHRWHDAAAITVAGLLAVVITPMVEAVFLLALQHSAVPEMPPDPGEAFAEPASEAERAARIKLNLPG